MKKSHYIRRSAVLSMAIMTTAVSLQMPVLAQPKENIRVGEIKADPGIHYQTLEGWGTSLCWWGNIIGAAGDRDFNGNGRPDREEIAELAFSPEYLNLNIVRYNVGGGDKPDSTIKRVEGRVPGWSRDMFGTDDGSGDFLGETFYGKSSEEMNDAGQIWMLEQANQWRREKGDIINKVFSNSPPYYMTKSGSSTGGNDWSKENLKEDEYDNFALYLARAAKWLDQNLNRKYGTGIDYIEPLNEPDTNYWLNGSTKQEGCIFYPGDSQIRAYQAVKQALTGEGLSDIKLTGTDETSLDKAIWSFEHLDTRTRADLDVISAHTYGGNDVERARLRGIAASYDKGLWMSEVTKGGGSHSESSHDSMNACNTKDQSEGIMSDLKQMQSSAWIAWLVADSEYECIQTDSNWGLIHYVFEEDGPVKGYHTNLLNEDGSKKDGVPEAGYWAVTKQFYTMMQYSKYLKAGYTMIDIGDANMCAAISPNREELVIVAQNFDWSERNTSVDLYKFPNASSVKLYRTSDSQNCEAAEASLSGGVLDVTLPASSVSTYVITGDGPLYEETSYKTIVDADVHATEDTQNAGATDMDKFTYTGSWADGWGQNWYKQEKYTTDQASYATFKFDGVQAAIYGKRSENGAELLVAVDGEEAVPVSAYASSEQRRSLLYTTPALEDGVHTVTVRMAENQTASNPEIVLEYAEITHGSVQSELSGLTKEALIDNDYVLYTVNCGTPDPSVLPNANSEKMGLLQSGVDQEYGADAKTGRKWGCDPADAYSMAVKGGIQPSDATDIGNTFVYMSDSVEFDKYKSGLGYSFELPKEKIEGISDDTYEVTVAFKHQWDNRLVNISLEGNTVATDVELGYDSWVSKTFTAKVEDGELNVRVQSPRRTSAKQDPILNFIKVRAVPDMEPEVITYDSFTGVNGEMMYDTDGKAIQAHGGQIQQLTVDGETKWYWIGEDKTNDYRPVGGIHVYSSTDLYNWKDEGVVLRTMERPSQFEEDPYFQALYGEYSEEKQEEIFIDLDRNNCVMERPKMIYNEKNDNYVIWFHADGRIPTSDADYGKAKAGIAVSDSPTGPFKLLGSYKLNYHNDPGADHGYDGWDGRGSVRDMNLFVDDDKTAYVIYSSEGNRTTFISRLNEDYTDLEVPRDEAVEGEHFTRNFIGWSREAPAMFKYNEKYYMINSGCTGWSPNPAQYMTADHPMGPWTAMGDPCEGWEADTTFRTQSTCVFPVDAENGKYIYMGDRWNAGYLRDSRYVWLPVEFMDDGRLVLKRYGDWKLEDLEGKGLAQITSEIPTQFESLAKLQEALPDTVNVSFGGEEILDAPVQWDAIDAEKPHLGSYRVNGTLTEQNRSIAHTAVIVDPGMQYFFDCNAETSDYFEQLQEAADGLMNMEPDQAYTTDNHAGYTGEPETDFGEFNGRDLYGSGWWAKKDKTIEYAFDLTPGAYTISTGYQGWWSVTRGMKVSAVALDEGNETELAAKEFTLESWEQGMTQTLDITIPETEEEYVKVLVRIEKTGSDDPILSFIGISSKDDTEEAAYRISGTVMTQDGDPAQDVELNLYKGHDINLASPSDAVRTDDEGVYTFEDLTDGEYSVELSAGDDQEAVVKNVIIDGMDVKNVNFIYGSGEEEEPESSIKIVEKPDKLIYQADEELDLTGIVVRGRNIGEEEVVELSETDYEAEYDGCGDECESGCDGVHGFLKPGTVMITIKYYLDEGQDDRKFLKDTFQIHVLEEDAHPEVKKIEITQKPYKTVYEVEEDFDPEGMVVEKTIRVATASDASYKEEVPLDDLELEVEEFSKAGTKEITVSYHTEDGAGEDLILSDRFAVTVTKSSNSLMEGTIQTALNRLEQELAYGEYVTEDERKEALSRAVASVEEGMEAYDGDVNSKIFKRLQSLEEKILEANPNITTSVQADRRFGSVEAEGLALSADLETEDYQNIKLKVQKSEEELPFYMKEDTRHHVAMEITLHANETEMQPKLPVRIRMDIPAGLDKENLVIYHLHNGEWNTIYPVIAGNQMSFIVSDFSLFIAANVKEEAVPERPSSSSGGGGSRYGNGKGGPGYTTPGTWKRDACGWWYQKRDGSYIHSSWALVNGQWYYFNESGYMVTGWILDGGCWYYLKEDGSMVSSAWMLLDGKWYYLTEDGKMAANTTTPDGYRVGGDGALVK